MAWSYASTGPFTTGSSAGRKNIIRRLVKDTSSGRQLLSNEEIAWYSSQNGNNVWRAAADICESLSAREAQSKSVGDLSLSGLGENYVALARQYRMRANSRVTPFAGGITVTDKDARAADTDRVAPFAKVGLHDTPGLESTGTT